MDLPATDHFSIVREIGIDAAHRVPLHGSKCARLHGHRYTIEAFCSGPLTNEGEQTSMVIDFGFLKEEMMRVIDLLCDHATILWYEDPLLELLLGDTFNDEMRGGIKECITKDGYCYMQARTCVGSRSVEQKLYLVPFAPTAEELARHWFRLLSPAVLRRSDMRAELTRIIVHETPNCRACYPV